MSNEEYELEIQKLEEQVHNLENELNNVCGKGYVLYKSDRISVPKETILENGNNRSSIYDKIAFDLCKKLIENKEITIIHQPNEETISDVYTGYVYVPGPEFWNMRMRRIKVDELVCHLRNRPENID